MTTWNVVLFGDSDISRWPPSLHPSPSAVRSEASNYGKGGAALADILHQIEEWRLEGGGPGAAANKNLFVCCAGENDVGSGRSVDRTLNDFRAVLDALSPPPRPTNDATQLAPSDESKVIFFGPKFEPWLTNDNASRKQYTKLNNGFQRAIRKRNGSAISYVDCLAMFCTEESAAAPGAVHGGRAVPDDKYFDADGLHLNHEGYMVWKRIVEEKMVEWGDEK